MMSSTYILSGSQWYIQKHEDSEFTSSGKTIIICVDTDSA